MKSQTRILAAASAGGHWIQLLRLQPAWEGCEVIFLSTEPSLQSDVVVQSSTEARFYAVAEASRWDKLRLIKSAIQVAFVIVRERPDVVITTGAAVGYFAILFGKIFGSRTVWVDSIANAEELSLSGKKAARFADVFLTQWPELESPEGPHYWGSVL